METPSRLRKALESNWLYLLIAVSLFVLPHLIGWLTGDSPFGVAGRPRGQSIFWQSLLIEVFILGILTMSYNLVFGFAGVISFGHALFFGMGGYIVGLMLEYTELDTTSGLVIGILVAMVVSGILGFLIGLVSLRLRGVYFAMFTLAIAEMFYIFFSRFSLTKAEDGFSITALPDWLDPTRNRLTYYYIVLVIFIAVFIFLRRLIFSPTGAVLLAIRENEERAKTIGYNTLNYKLLALTTAGMLAAVAGVLQIVFNKKVGPELLSLSYTVDPLLMTIIGGAGTFAGPIIGASGLHLADRLLRDRTIAISETFVIDIGASWTLILGVIFIVVVMVFPQGIVGTWIRWRAKRSKPTSVAIPSKVKASEQQPR